MQFVWQLAGGMAVFACLLALLWPFSASAAELSDGIVGQIIGPDATVMGPDAAAQASLILPSYWYLLMGALALLVPAGLILVSVAGLDAEQAWHAALGGMAALGLAGVAYWAVGFALQFGGVGVPYAYITDLNGLDLEWSALSNSWGRDWGMAGLSGWFLSGAELTPLVYALFLAHLPWAIAAAALPVVALRQRASTAATLVIAVVMAGIVYPLAGNWVQGGGWLSALGRNLNLGHGLIDVGGAGSVHLVTGGFVLAALVVFVPRHKRNAAPTLPPAQLPLLAVAGSIFVLVGTVGWLWSNPLQVSVLSDIGLMRGTIGIMLAAGGGVIVPLLYTWFVTGRTDPLMSSRGLVAGVVAGLAAAPFVQPGPAFLIGLLSGATVPFVTFIVDGVLRLDDSTGAVQASFVPGVLGLLLAGIWADGVVGVGWQLVGVNDYLGVAGQGVSGIFTASGLRPDFPGQLQAQVIGILALGIWGFGAGMAVCTPLSLFFYALSRNNKAATQPASDDFYRQDVPSQGPLPVDGFDTTPTPFQLEDGYSTLPRRDANGREVNETNPEQEIVPRRTYPFE